MAIPGRDKNSQSLEALKVLEAEKYKIVVASERTIAAVREKYRNEDLIKHDRAVRELEIQANNRIAAEKARLKDALKQEGLTEDAKLDLIRKSAEAERKILEELENEKKSQAEIRVKLVMKADAEVAKKAQQLDEARYKRLNIYQRKNFLESKRQAAQETKATLEQMLIDKEAALEVETDATTQAELLKEIEEINQEIVSATEVAAEARKKELEVQKLVRAAEMQGLTYSERYAENLAEAAKIKEQLDELQKEMYIRTEMGLDTSDLEETIKELTNAQIEAQKAAAENRKQAREEKKVKKDPKYNSVADRKAAHQKVKELSEDPNASEEDLAKAQAEAEKYDAAHDEAMDAAKDKAIVDAVNQMGSLLSDFSKSIDTNIKSFYQYQAQINARLEGSEHNYQKSLRLITKNVGVSGFMKQADVIEKLKELTEAGVAYNLDLRAFLMTLQEEVVDTFNALDDNLRRLIRAQQADTTAARMGMEAALKKFLNKEYQDTSYLSDAFDSVSQAIIDANAQLTRDESIAFEHAIQKWLGALYSVGLDGGTASKIASGLNYLGTGNVEALEGDSALNSLLAMSASRAGISYADILTGGLDSDTTNKLMKSMVEYLASIAENTDNNQVSKAAYSNLYGMSMTDLKAFSTLTDTDISNLFNNSMSYSSSIKEVENQLGKVFFRTHLSQIMSNMFDNALLTASTSIGSNPALYTTWTVLNIIEDLTGGINLPAVSVMGNMVDLSAFTVTGLGKMGIAGLGLLGGLMSSIFGGSLFGTTKLSKWGYDDYTARGKGIKAISKGTAQEVSESTELNMVGSASGDDVKQTGMSDGAAGAEEDSKTTNQSVEDEADSAKELGETVEKILNVITDIDTRLKTAVYTVRAQLDLSAMSTPLPVSLDTWMNSSFFSRTEQIIDKESDLVTQLLSGYKVTSEIETHLDQLATETQLDSLLKDSEFSSTFQALNTAVQNDQIVQEKEATLITPEGLKVSLQDMSPVVQNFFLAALRSMNISAIDSQTGEQIDLPSAIAKSLENTFGDGSSLKVVVTNDTGNPVPVRQGVL